MHKDVTVGEIGTMTTIGDRIKDRRIELGWTQDALAQKAGLSKSFLSDLENGKRSIGADKLLDIGKTLGLSLDFLMTGARSVGSIESAEIQIPTSLAQFADEAGITFRQAMTLLGMQRQIDAHKSAKREKSEDVDWCKLYEAVKEFL